MNITNSYMHMLYFVDKISSTKNNSVFAYIVGIYLTSNEVLNNWPSVLIRTLWFVYVAVFIICLHNILQFIFIYQNFIYIAIFYKICSFAIFVHNFCNRPSITQVKPFSLCCFRALSIFISSTHLPVK